MVNKVKVESATISGEGSVIQILNVPLEVIAVDPDE
jgi:hypothetical protein